MQSNLKEKPMEHRFHNTPTDQLYEMLQAATMETARNISTVCDILFALAERGERHTLMRNSTFRWYREVARGELAPEAIMAFAGLNAILTRLVGIPLGQQRQFADGEPLPVAEKNLTTGDVETSVRPLVQMSMHQLDQVFEAPGKLRSLTQQKKQALKGDAPAKMSGAPAEPLFTADELTGEIVCGSLRFKPGRIRRALGRLGYKLVKE